MTHEELTRYAQQQIVSKAINQVQIDFLALSVEGKIPGHWTDAELLLWLSDKLRPIGIFAGDKQLLRYKHDVKTNKLLE